MISKIDFTRRLAKKLKILRAQNGMSQEDLAHAAEMSPRYVGHLESGKYSPSSYTLLKLIKALNIDPKELVFV